MVLKFVLACFVLQSLVSFVVMVVSTLVVASIEAACVCEYGGDNGSGIALMAPERIAFVEMLVKGYTRQNLIKAP